MRYRIRYIYGRHEIVDQFSDYAICYAYRSEEAQQILDAMNTMYEIGVEVEVKNEKTE